MKGCGRCGFRGALTRVADEVVEDHPYDDPKLGDLGWQRRWIVGRCPHCEQPTVAQYDWADHRMEPGDEVMRVFDGASPSSDLHPRVQEKALALFHQEHWAEAVEASVKAVRQLLRERAVITADGEALITSAFAVARPRLRFSALETETQINEQVGFMTLLQGYWKHVRHVRAHSDTGDDLGRDAAWDLLQVASWLCSSIDRCEAAEQ